MGERRLPKPAWADAVTGQQSELEELRARVAALDEVITAAQRHIKALEREWHAVSWPTAVTLRDALARLPANALTGARIIGSPVAGPEVEGE